MFEQDLNIGEVVSNDRIHDIFGCQTQGRDTPEQLAEMSNLAGSPGRYFDRISRRFAAFPLRTLSEDSKKKSALRRNRVEKNEQ